MLFILHFSSWKYDIKSILYRYKIHYNHIPCRFWASLKMLWILAKFMAKMCVNMGTHRRRLPSNWSQEWGSIESIDFRVGKSGKIRRMPSHRLILYAWKQSCGLYDFRLAEVRIVLLFFFIETQNNSTKNVRNRIFDWPHEIERAKRNKTAVQNAQLASHKVVRNMEHVNLKYCKFIC